MRTAEDQPILKAFVPVKLEKLSCLLGGQQNGNRRKHLCSRQISLAGELQPEMLYICKDGEREARYRRSDGQNGKGKADYDEKRKKIKCGQISGHSWAIKQFYSCVSRYLNTPKRVQSTSDIFRNAEWWGVREGWGRGGETWARNGRWRHQRWPRPAWGRLLWQAGGLKQRPQATWKEKVTITFSEAPTHQIQVEATESECGKLWEGGINPRSLHLTKKADRKKLFDNSQHVKCWMPHCSPEEEW